MFYRSTQLRGIVLLAIASLFATFGWADGPEVVGVGGGVTYGSGGGTHALFGGGTSFGISDNIRLLGEVTYSPLMSLTDNSTGVTIKATEHILGFGGGVDYSFLDRKAKARPYVTAVVGLDHATASGSVSGASTPVSLSISSNSVYYGAGGGLRYFVGKSWGIKPEIRYQHSVDTGNALIYSVGLFYRFGE